VRSEIDDMSRVDSCLRESDMQTKHMVIGICLWLLSIFFFYIAYDGIRRGVFLGGIHRICYRNSNPIQFWLNVFILMMAGVFIIVVGALITAGVLKTG
jgi:hypothetical protein